MRCSGSFRGETPHVLVACGRTRARKLGLGVMMGCNLGTSLAMAPAFLIGQLSDFVDVDGHC